MANKAKIKSILDKINWLFKSFEESDFENISALEKSLLKEKVLMFYDEIENLQTKIQIERMDIPKPFENISEEKIIEELIVDEPEEDFIEDIKVEEPAIEKIEIVVETPEVPTVTFETPEIAKEAVEIKAVAEVIVEKPTIETPIPNPSVEEVKKEKFEKTEEFQRQVAMPKRDMREIIDLNKSFIFKGQLFNQNNDLYNQFINEMNTTRNENDAFTVLINWTEKLNWETEENKAYDLLLRSIEKRFLPLL